MRTLYYSAFASPQVAPALATQANESLRPFVAYLNAAMAAAKEREARSRCRWEPVPFERPLCLRALDSLLEIKSDGFGYRVLNWTAAAPQMPLFVGAQFRPVQPTRVDETGGRVVVWLAEAGGLFRQASDQSSFDESLRRAAFLLLGDRPAIRPAGCGLSPGRGADRLQTGVGRRASRVQGRKHVALTVKKQDMEQWIEARQHRARSASRQ